MGFFKTRKGRLRVWVYILLCLIIVPAAGFGVAMVVQPERFARDDACVSLADGKIVNSCGKAVLAEACVVADDGIRECIRREVPASGSIERPDKLKGDKVELTACYAPYIPARVASPLNLSLLIESCRKPDAE
ncbi:MAG: hypothetical protein R3D43_14660 [Tepidamorphaceae bacterium]